MSEVRQEQLQAALVNLIGIERRLKSLEREMAGLRGTADQAVEAICNAPYDPPEVGGA